MKSQKSKIKNFFTLIKIISIITTFNFALLIFNLDKAAASALSLGIFPPILQITAMPPANIKAAIIVKNFGEETVDLDILFKPFADNQNSSIFNQIQVFDDNNPLKSITLAPKQEKKLTLVIDIPKNEKESEYYFSIVFISKAIKNNNTNYSQILGGVATNVLLSIGSKDGPQGEIREFSSVGFLQKGPVAFTVSLKNKGKHFITPRGDILIKNMFGQTVGNVDLLASNVLAGTVRSQKEFWDESFILGPYTAILTISLSEKGPILNQTVHFIGLPGKYIVGVVLAIFLSLLIRNRLKTHLK